MDDMLIRKELANRLTEVVKTDRTALSILQLLCNNKTSTDDYSADIWTGPFEVLRGDTLGFNKSEEKPSNRSIGIWEEDAKTGDFIRSARHIDLWRFCANVDRIKKKSTKKRVLFLGESVARGFLLSPSYCPAPVLEEQLCSMGESVEVVDLAQSNCGPQWLVEMASSASLLNPDAIVVFAGNNWRAGPLTGTSAEDFILGGELLTADGGLSKLMERQRQRVEDITTQTMMDLSHVAANVGAPLIFVIPELNIADWFSSATGILDVPHMDKEKTQSWVSAYSDGKKAIMANSYVEAEEYARKAIDLDDGTSSASLELLSQALLNQGKIQAASSTLRQSRDVIDDTRVLPGIFTNVADTIRRMGPQLGITIVDLPQIFAEYNSDELPGRRHFFDYCHLNVEGIKLSMAATAKELAPVLFSKEANITSLIDTALSPSAEQEGWAHLLAGIHNAHWGQSHNICKHHFKKAAEYYPDIENVIAPLVFDAYRHAAPHSLITSFGEMVKNRIASTYLMGYALISRGLISEYSLLQSLIDTYPSLENMAPDPDFTLGEISEIDLLQDHWSELMDCNRWFRRGFTAVYGLESNYLFVCDSSLKLLINLTCRIPGAQKNGNIVISLNNIEIGYISANNDWCSGQFLIDDQIVKQGFNNLNIYWPNVPRADMRSQLRLDFETGQYIDTRRHFGHIYELNVSSTQ